MNGPGSPALARQDRSLKGILATSEPTGQILRISHICNAWVH